MDDAVGSALCAQAASPSPSSSSVLACSPSHGPACTAVQRPDGQGDSRQWAAYNGPYEPASAEAMYTHSVAVRRLRVRWIHQALTPYIINALGLLEHNGICGSVQLHVLFTSRTRVRTRSVFHSAIWQHWKNAVRP
jgi:hypothetical protein